MDTNVHGKKTVILTSRCLATVCPTERCANNTNVHGNRTELFSLAGVVTICPHWWM